MRYVLIPFLLFGVTAAIAQQKKIPNPKAYASTITEADLKQKLTIVASADMQGRETATEGERKAAAYIESHFKSLGLLPGNQGSYQQYYPVYRDSLVTAKLVINGTSLTSGTDFQPSAFYATEAKYFFSEIVYAGYGVVDSVYDSYGKTSIAGKAVIIVEGGPTGLRGGTGRFSSSGTQAKVTHARNKGAAVIFIVSATLAPNSTAGRMYLSLFRDTQYPGTYMITNKTAEMFAGSEWNAMKEKLKTERPDPKAFKVQVEVSLDRKVQKLKSSNVLGVLEGTDKKDEYLVVTAHYDHLGKRGDAVYYGADDDGSGTVSVLEMAEAFAKAKLEGKGPRRSIIFMTVSGEEKGLWGSQYFSQNPTVSPDKITANLNIDMIGRTDPQRVTADSTNYVYVVGDDKLSTESKPMVQQMNSKYTQISLDYKFNDPKDVHRIYFRSDHYNFARLGVPIIFFYDGMLLGDYHKPTDTIDKINFGLMAKRARLVFYTAWEMANRDAMMKRDLPMPFEER